jgi:myo-inositol-1(or 4)-monophosphatase
VSADAADEADEGLAGGLLDLACEQAVGAGELLLERFRSGAERGVRSKSTPTDLVSDADLEAERHIREGIARRRPDDGFLGEEGDDSEGDSGLRWVVDPLDGTVNFLFGIPYWCVSVAVEDRRGTLAGAICDPLRNELFTAVRGGESRLLSGPGVRESFRAAETAGRRYEPGIGGREAGRRGIDGREAGRREADGRGIDGREADGRGIDGREAQALAGSAREELASAMVATGFSYDAHVRAAQAQALTRVLPRVRDIRRAGAAALDLAWTAAGRYDAFYERGVHTWDVAAGVLMCERAGLRARELPEADGLPWGVLVAPPGLVDELLEVVLGPPPTT